jgi:hypothetical protein
LVGVEHGLASFVLVIHAAGKLAHNVRPYICIAFTLDILRWANTSP